MKYLIAAIALLVAYYGGRITLGLMFGDAVQPQHVFICLLVFGTLGGLFTKALRSLPLFDQASTDLAKGIDKITRQDKTP
ncbi:MAG: hypothetical protein EON60_05565 [Alphaproteobacteria bacterium]|nr:MAG: hypothetical protein EON60_05565 [Alphaproteobacteria bacterium]